MVTNGIFLLLLLSMSTNKVLADEHTHEVRFEYFRLFVNVKYVNNVT